MNFSPANITALVIAASFAAGLNIYATVLTLGILARTQWVALPPGLDSLGHTWVLVVCGIMFAMAVLLAALVGSALRGPGQSALAASAMVPNSGEILCLWKRSYTIATRTGNISAGRTHHG